MRQYCHAESSFVPAESAAGVLLAIVQSWRVRALSVKHGV